MIGASYPRSIIVVFTYDACLWYYVGKGGVEMFQPICFVAAFLFFIMMLAVSPGYFYLAAIFLAVGLWG
jgi:hypothetical protein